jgi:phospholipid-binding lipoprotein MlaA
LRSTKQEEDLGQTLGVWGMGPAFYIDWPILGPSSVRDSIGFVGDLFLDPRTYVFSDPIFYIVRPVEIVNETSLRIGEYEDLKEAAIDPYVAKRDAYFQYRENKIKR